MNTATGRGHLASRRQAEGCAMGTGTGIFLITAGAT
jgi:hypothetical protein